MLSALTVRITLSVLLFLLLLIGLVYRGHPAPRPDAAVGSAFPGTPA